MPFHRPSIRLIAIVSLTACDMGSSRGADPAESERRATPVDAALLAAMPTGSTAETVVEARELYRVCLVCHGAVGEGTALGPPLVGREWTHVEGGLQEIEQIVRNGVARPEEFPVPMPPMGGGSFDDRQLSTLAAYVQALGRRAQ